MKKYIFITIFVAACSTISTRNPQSQKDDLLKDLQSLKTVAESEELNSNNCQKYLSTQLESLAEEKLQTISGSDVNSYLTEMLKMNWQAYLAIHKKLDELTVCRAEVRKIFFRLRSMRDLIHGHLYAGKPLIGTEIDFQKQPIPLRENDFYQGYLSASGEVETRPLSLHSGDLMLTRGTSHFSALLAGISENQGQFSHFVLVHKSADGAEQTMEAYAQSGGVTRFQMDYALKNENSRILILRPKNEELGARAAQVMMTKIVEEEQGVRSRTRYDYKMSLESKDKMTCSEVSYWAYLEASDGKFILPQERSNLSPKLKQVLKKTGISSEPILTPQDMEVDSRFEVVAEFTDRRLSRDNILREVTLQSMFDWIKQKDYWIQITGKTLAIDAVIYPLRKTKVWPGFQKLTKVADFPADMPKGFLKTVSQVNGISDVLYKKLVEEENRFFKKTGWGMTRNQMLSTLEEFRKEDFENYMSGRQSELHLLFRPVGAVPNNSY